jgi:hypothetical protein
MVDKSTNMRIKKRPTKEPEKYENLRSDEDLIKITADIHVLPEEEETLLEENTNTPEEGESRA